FYGRRADVHFDFSDGRPVAVRHLIYDHAFRRLKPWRQIGWEDKAGRSREGFSDMSERDFHLGGALDNHMLTDDVEIGSIDFEQMTSDEQRLVTYFGRRDVRRRASHYGLPAVKAAKAH